MTQQPQTKINEGRGRILLASIRRARLNAQIVAEYTNPSYDLRADFSKQLSSDASLVTQIIDLLRAYAAKPDEQWRLIWLLYVGKDIALEQLPKPVAKSWQQTMLLVQTSPRVPPAAKLWARNVPELPPRSSQIETIHAKDYVEGGELFVGIKGHA